MNLVPFRDIGAVLRSGDGHRAPLQLGGNVLLFLPVGLLLAGVLRRPSPAVLLSAAQESLQHLVGRSVDVDDVLLNGTGVVLGVLLTLLVRRAAGRTAGDHGPGRGPGRGPGHGGE